MRMALSTSTVLYTPRFVLRPFRRRDTGAVHEAVLASLPDLAAYLPWANDRYTKSVTAQYIRESAAAWSESRAFDFAIRAEAEPDRHIGNMSVWFTSRPNGVGEVGYWVRSDQTSNGVATEAGARILQFAFEELGMHRVTVRIAVGNRASERVAGKLGFQLEGTLREDVKVGHVWLDHSLWSMLAQEWPRTRQRYRAEAWI